VSKELSASAKVCVRVETFLSGFEVGSFFGRESTKRKGKTRMWARKDRPGSPRNSVSTRRLDRDSEATRTIPTRERNGDERPGVDAIKLLFLNHTFSK